MSAALALDWTDPAAIGYPVLFGGVLLGSIVPVVPTGAVVGAAAAVAMTTGDLSLPLVLLLSTLAALLGDLITFAVCPGRRPGGGALGGPRPAPGAARRGARPVRAAAGRSSSSGGCCRPAGSRCCWRPGRWPTRGGGCCRRRRWPACSGRWPTPCSAWSAAASSTPRCWPPWSPPCLVLLVAGRRLGGHPLPAPHRGAARERAGDAAPGAPAAAGPAAGATVARLLACGR